MLPQDSSPLSSCGVVLLPISIEIYYVWIFLGCLTIFGHTFSTHTVHCLSKSTFSTEFNRCPAGTQAWQWKILAEEVVARTWWGRWMVFSDMSKYVAIDMSKYMSHVFGSSVLFLFKPRMELGSKLFVPMMV